MARSFLIKDTSKEKYVAGPFARKKAKRLLGEYNTAYGEGIEKRYILVPVQKAEDWDGVKHPGEFDPNEQDIADRVLSENKKNTKQWDFQTGLFNEKSSVEQLVQRLQLTDFEIFESRRGGFFAVYNDNDDE